MNSVPGEQFFDLQHFAEATFFFFPRRKKTELTAMPVQRHRRGGDCFGPSYKLPDNTGRTPYLIRTADVPTLQIRCLGCLDFLVTL